LALVKLDELIASGAHFGHRINRLNPKMKPYIFGRRNQIHIIDLRRTVRGLVAAAKLVEKVVASGKDALIVGTKRQARGVVSAEAMRAGMPYVNERWLGGTLTNFTTILSRMQRLHELEGMETTGEMERLGKKEVSALRRELRKVRRNLGGLRKLQKLPGIVVVVDAGHESTAIHEAAKLGIPSVALADTDCNPDEIDIVVPSNDDSIATIGIFLGRMADACVAGKLQRVALGAQDGDAQAAQQMEYIRIAAPLDKAESAAQSGSDEGGD